MTTTSLITVIPATMRREDFEFFDHLMEIQLVIERSLCLPDQVLLAKDKTNTHPLFFREYGRR